MKKVKRIIVAVVGDTVLAIGAVVVALAVRVLFVIPGGVGILTIEWEWATRWLRRACASLLGINPPLKQ